MAARDPETAAETEPEPQAEPEPEPAWRDLDSAHALVRRSAAVLDRAASVEGWPVPFSPVRFLVLAHLASVSRFGLTPRRLSWLLSLRPSSLAHHLDVLEGAGLIERTPRGLMDGRQVAVRPTDEGRFAAWRMAAALERDRDARAPSAGPLP